jgi:hypothetical protein
MKLVAASTHRMSVRLLILVGTVWAPWGDETWRGVDAFGPSRFVIPSTPFRRYGQSTPDPPQSESQPQQLVRERPDSEIRRDAAAALSNVGWSAPADDGSLTADDPFVRSIDRGIQRDFGVGLEDLLNPAKVVNLERDLYGLRQELAIATGASVGTDDSDNDAFTRTDTFDAGGGGAVADDLRQKIAKKEANLVVERRSVFRGWLKNVFLIQAVLSFGLSYVMATNPAVLFGRFDWFSSVYNMDISVQVLGYWWWWLFIVPSLRSRRPRGPEKRALDVAFLATPAVSLLAPVATKDTAAIWTANLVVVLAAYAWAYATTQDDNDDSNNSDDDANQPAWLKFLYKSLDFGSGRERGARQ